MNAPTRASHGPAPRAAAPAPPAGSPARSRALILSLMAAELRVFGRQPIMLAIALLLPAGLLLVTALGGIPDDPDAWAHTGARNLLAVQCISVYFVALNTLTARRHTLALKRLRTTAVPSPGIVVALLTPPAAIGLLQSIAVGAGTVALGGPVPDRPGLLAAATLTGILIASCAGVLTSALTSTPEKAQWTMMPLFVASLGAVSVLPTMSEGLALHGIRLIPMVANADLAALAWGQAGAEVTGSAVSALAIVAWCLALPVLSWRTFRWERRR